MDQFPDSPSTGSDRDHFP